jgi:hypothetical protein
LNDEELEVEVAEKTEADLQEEEELRQRILDWKEQHWNIYYAEIDEEQFLFREVSCHEYRTGIRVFGDDTVSLEEYICKLCVLEPSDYDFTNCIAGIPTTLAKLILNESGFGEATDPNRLSDYLEKFRDEMLLVNNQMACAIKEAFPNFSLEEIENWPMQKVAWYFSRAEFILRQYRGIMPVGDNEQPKQRAQPSTPTVKQKENNLDPEAGKFKYQLNGSSKDFPELAEIDAFMKGKWNPTPIPEGEAII